MKKKDPNKLTPARVRELAMLPEKLTAASRRRKLCVKCGLGCTCQSPYMKPWVPKGWTRKVLIVGEGPGEHEDEVTGRQFTGAAGKLLKVLLRIAGYKKEDIAFTNAVRCRPPGNATPNMTQIRACRPFLLTTIQTLRPKYVFLLGASALRSALNMGSGANVTENRGKWLTIPGLTGRKPKVLCTYHPSAILHGAVSLRDLIIDDLQRPTWKTLPWPKVASPKNRKVVGFDTEFHDKKVTDWGFADEKFAFSVDGDDDRALRKPYNLPRAAEILVGHSVSQDVDFLIQRNLAKKEWVTGVGLRDSFLLAKMVDENRTFKGGYELENLVRSYYNVEPWKQKTKAYSKTDSSEWPADLRRERVRLDAWGSLVLARRLEPLVRGPVELTHRIAQTLHRIELAGMYVSMRSFNSLARTYGNEVEKTRDLLYKQAMKLGFKDFKPTNDGHLRDILFKRLRLKPMSYTEKEGLPQVNALFLKTNRDKHPFLEYLLAFNKADKVHSTYIEGVAKHLEDCGRNGFRFLPVRIRAMAARTGRRSSAAPNMQNWPGAVRQMVRSRFKNGKILDNDFSKLEILLIAWLADEERLMEFFLKSPNGYIEVAQRLFKKTVEEGSPDYRAMKAIILGTNYNKKGKSLAYELWWSRGVKLHHDYEIHEERAEKLRLKYLGMFPGLVTYMRKQETLLLKTGESVSATDRVRHLPVKQGRDTPGFWHLRNEAINHPVQSLAGDVTGSAMVDIERELLREYKLSYNEYHKMLLSREWLDMPLLINEVHDELVYDMPERNRKRDTELIIETMRSVPTLRKLVKGFDVPLNVGSKLADCWTK